MRVAIRKNDEVQVISGKDKGKRGRVVNVLPKRNRVQVEGIARATKHVKPTRARMQGGIVQQELFVDVSNVQIVCKHCGKPTRIGHRMEEDVKVRFCRRCGGEL